MSKGLSCIDDIDSLPSICTLCLDVKMASYIYPQYCTLSNKILLVLSPKATACVIQHTPLKFIEAARFWSHVHVSPGVFLMHCMEIDLGIGMKHMFH